MLLKPIVFFFHDTVVVVPDKEQTSNKLTTIFYIDYTTIVYKRDVNMF